MLFPTLVSWLCLALIGPAAAHFQFFENMFQQGHGPGQQQQPRQNVASDSAGYREHYSNCTYKMPSSPRF